MGSRLGHVTIVVGWPLLGLELKLGFEDSTQNRVIAKDVKSCNYYCYVKYATLIVRVRGNAFPTKNRRNSLPCTVKT